MKKIACWLFIVVFVLGCNPPGAAEKVADPKKRAIKTHKVQARKVRTYIETTGAIRADLEGAVKVVSPLAGSVEAISVKVGDKVKKNDLLLTMRSTEVGDAHSRYRVALSQLRQAERVYSLNKQLFEVGAATKNDLLTSEADLEQVRAEVSGLKRKLEIYGIDLEEMRDLISQFPIKAPINGNIAEIRAHVGDRMDTSVPMLTIVDTARIFVVADIYDTDIHKIQKNKEVSFTTDIAPDIVFKGVVSYVSDMGSLESKTVKTYIKMSKGMDFFKLNMFLRIKIEEGERSLPVIPKTAMIYRKGKFYVHVKTGDRFDLKEIRPWEDISINEISVEGINEGDEIILSAIDEERV